MSLLLLLSCAQVSQAVVSQHLVMSTYAEPPAVYRTDFENVTMRDAHELNMRIDNWFEFGGDGGAAMWVEGLDRSTPGFTCHSGVRCVGMELTNINESRRNEFNIMHLENLVGNELYVSVWLYLPAGWALHSPSWNSYEIANPYFTGGPTYLPYSAIHITQSNITKNKFNLDFDVRNDSGTLSTLKEIPNYPLPRGQWFNLQYYVYRHATSGIVKVWIQNSAIRSLLWDAENISTSNPSVTEWFTTVAKIYYDSSDKFQPYRIWVDDLEIYGTQPQPSISGFPVESILLGVIMGLGALVVMRRGIARKRHNDGP